MHLVWYQAGILNIIFLMEFVCHLVVNVHSCSKCFTYGIFCHLGYKSVILKNPFRIFFFLNLNILRKIITKYPSYAYLKCDFKWFCRVCQFISFLKMPYEWQRFPGRFIQRAPWTRNLLPVTESWKGRALGVGTTSAFHSRESCSYSTLPQLPPLVT